MNTYSSLVDIGIESTLLIILYDLALFFFFLLAFYFSFVFLEKHNIVDNNDPLKIKKMWVVFGIIVGVLTLNSLEKFITYQQEIDHFKYSNILILKEKNDPEINKMIDLAIKDGKITNIEYRVISKLSEKDYIDDKDLLMKEILRYDEYKIDLRKMMMDKLKNEENK
jgi:hypothetical protein